ncbi:tRNA (guanine-N(7)-)-methyltransferase non-catalytic subunit WDR4-like [Oppia nitens]|uniref:tRNA (guanine-N(7)-)-methyltransferase non-catalytic subunit WDR4-like n=1 Tax=Oppia nitens TaxID=1686743 RepID=UPI0023DB2762|nr:tRNA (guanine-N(7)-)-methyltransferase non-catalytic subunit WDR4-like [Oppia nitens]
MLFTVCHQFVAICHINTNNKQLIIYDLKSDDKSHIDIQSIVCADKNNEKTQPVTDDYTILCGDFNARNDCLAIADNRKQLIIFQYIDKQWKQTFKTKVSRNCIKLLFSINNSVICGHKSGDVFEYEMNDSYCNSQSGDYLDGGRLLLGHCSMLLDVIQTQNGKYLITTDRDEKIRVSRYPNTYNIETYCLGHKEFVSSVGSFNDKILVSGSGDGSIRLWNINDGKQVNLLNCDPNEDNQTETRTQFAVKKLVTNCDILCVSFFKQSVVNVYTYESTNLTIKLIHNLNLKTEPINLYFDINETNVLWILLATDVKPLNLFKISEENIINYDIYHKIVDELNNNQRFVNNCVNALKNTDFEGLYKQSFNNVETYMKQKQERQQTNNKKTKFYHFSDDN